MRSTAKNANALPIEPVVTVTAEPESDEEKPVDWNNGFREFAIVVGRLASAKLPYGAKTLADAVSIHFRDHFYSQSLDESLGLNRACTLSRVIERFIGFEKWYQQRYKDGKKAKLFADGGPATCTKLTPEGESVYKRIEEQESALAIFNNVSNRLRDGDDDELDKELTERLMIQFDRTSDLRHTTKELGEETSNEASVPKKDSELKDKQPDGSSGTWAKKVASKSPSCPPPLDTSLAAQYDQVYAEMKADSDTMLKSLAERFVPVFNAKVRQEFETRNPQSVEQRTEFSEWIMEQLAGLNLTLFDSVKKRPAYFRVTAINEYELTPKGSKNGKKSVEFEEFLPLKVSVSGPFKWSETKPLKEFTPQSVLR